MVGSGSLPVELAASILVVGNRDGFVGAQDQEPHPARPPTPGFLLGRRRESRLVAATAQERPREGWAGDVPCTTSGKAGARDARNARKAGGRARRRPRTPARAGRSLRRMTMNRIRGRSTVPFVLLIMVPGMLRAQPPGLRAAVQVLLFMVSSPLQWQKAAPSRDAADKFLDEQMRSRLSGVDANDMLYQFEASREYDPSKDLEKIRAPLLAINSADDQVNPPELGLMERLIRRVPRGRFVLIPTGDDTRGHGTHSYPALWKFHLEEFLREIKGSSVPAR